MARRVIPGKDERAQVVPFYQILVLPGLYPGSEPVLEIQRPNDGQTARKNLE
jgi:hypothetical protein